MRDETFTLEPAVGEATPPFTYGYVPARRRAFWHLREANGRSVGRANTRSGARAGVRTLYEQLQDAEASAAMRGTA